MTTFGIRDWFDLLLLIVLPGVAVYLFFRMRLFQRRFLEARRQCSEMEKLVKKEMNALERLIDLAGTGIIQVSADGRVIRWNRRASKIFGLQENEIVGKNIALLDLEDDVLNFDIILKGAEESGELYQIETKKQAHSKRIVELIMTVTPIRPEDDGLTGYLLTLDDFSSRNQLVEALLDHEKVVAGSDTLNQLLGTLSHHFNNAIMAISGLAQLTRVDASYKDRLLQTIDNQMMRMRGVLNALSHLADQLNLKTTNYIEESGKIFDIEEELQEFIRTMKKPKNS